MERKLIFKDSPGEFNFLRGLLDAMERSNELLKQFNTLQPWKKVETQEDWLRLVASPQAYYDNTILENVKLSEGSGLSPNVELLAQLFDVPREAFINIIQGVSFDEQECKPCKTHKLKIRKGKPAITLREFRTFEEFLLFSPAGFTLDEDKKAEHLKTFEKFTMTEEELEIVKYWEGLAQIFNYHCKELGLFGPVKLQEACKLFGLKYADNTAFVSPDLVYNEIQRLRHEKSILK